MRRHRTQLRYSLRCGSRHNPEEGVVITLVAVFMLFVVGAMAALSIDVVTMYTARSEAQLAADSAALAAARVLANSGATSDAALLASVENPAGAAQIVALQVAEQNKVGGTNVASGQVTVSFAGIDTNPTVTVRVQIPNLPTFFARMLGIKFVTVGASATAEAYNPSGTRALGETPIPVAPICVKPWLLPNIDPTQTNTSPPANPIFLSSGAIANPGLVGQSWPNTTVANANPNGLLAMCSGDCSTFPPNPLPFPVPGQYYPGAIDATDFPAPTQALPTCSAGFIAYQKAVAGCVQRPISCGVPSAINPSAINIDTTAYTASTGSRDSDTVTAAECLIHYSNGAGQSDSIDPLAAPSPPFEFLGGSDNPVAGARTNDVLVSDSLVTIPVIDSSSFVNPSTSATVIGFLQVFLNPASAVMPPPGPPPYQIPVTIINMVGCGNPITGAIGPPILGNGASPVAVRLISPP